MDRNNLERSINVDKRDGALPHICDKVSFIHEGVLDYNYYESARLFMENSNLIIREFIYDKGDYQNTSTETKNFKTTLDEAINKSQQLTYSKKGSYYRIEINYQKIGWEYLEFNSSLDGLFKAFKAIYKNGFYLSNEDLESWENEFDKERKHMEKDDEELVFAPGIFKKFIRNKKINQII